VLSSWQLVAPKLRILIFSIAMGRNYSFELKGQIISKWFFDVFLQKPNKNKYHTSKNEFIRSFFGGKTFLKLSDL
jgi:hypothetical protein